MTKIVSDNKAQGRRLQKVELQFLRAEKKSLVALTALMALAVSQSDFDEMRAPYDDLMRSFDEMVVLKKTFNTVSTGALQESQIERLAASYKAIATTSRDKRDRAVKKATYSLARLHGRLTALLPSWFTPLVQGDNKPDKPGGN